MALKLANNATSVLAGSIDAVASTISVASGDGSLFPSLGAGDWFPLTLVKSDGTREVLKCTARASDVLTVTRGQEGTSAAAFTAGSRVDLRLTAAAITEVTGAVADLESSLPTTYVALADAASQAEAEAGTDDDKWMTPLRTQQAIDINTGTMAAKDVATAADISANTGTDGITTDQAWAAAAVVDLGTKTGTVTIDLDAGSCFLITLGGNITVALPSNPKSGQAFTLFFKQDATGSRTISWGSGWNWPDNTTPLYSTSAGSTCLVVSASVGATTAYVVGSGFKLA